jgi:hypothetical protein
MATVGQTARVTHRGSDVPDVRAGTVSAAAALVWEGMAGRAKLSDNSNPRSSDEEVRGAFYRRNTIVPVGIAGYEWHGAVRQIVRDVWPAMSDEEDIEKLNRDVNAYLAATGNAICVINKKGHTPVWWVRAIWTDATPGEQALRGPERRTDEHRLRQEARITPAQAGETRDPEPVKTLYQCTWPRCKRAPFDSETGRTAHHLRDHRSARSYLTAALAYADGELLAGSAIYDLCRIMGCPASDAVLARELGTMVDRKLAATPEGQRLYAQRGTKAPSRLSPYRCAEPGCSFSFADRGTRHHHENSAHPDSPAQVYRVSTSLRRFYSHQGATVALAKGDGGLVLPLPCREGCGEIFTHHIVRRWHEDNEHPESPARTDHCSCTRTFYPSGGDLSRHQELAHGSVHAEASPAPAATVVPEAPVAEVPAPVAEVAVTPPAVPAVPAEALRAFLRDYDELQAENARLREENARLELRESARRELAARLLEG